MEMVSDKADADGAIIVMASLQPILVRLSRHRWNPVESGESGWIFQSDSLDINAIQWSPVSPTGYPGQPCWTSMASSGVRWCPMVSDGVRWCPMVSAGVRQSLLESTGVHWSLVDSGGLNCCTC